MTVRNLPGFRAFSAPGGSPEAVVAGAAGRNWFSIENKDDNSATIRLYDAIGMWGDSAADFATQVADLRVNTIDLRLNSPGGSVFDGVTIYNTLLAHPAAVNVTVDGIAASIASVIAMAGDTITMGRGTRMMIHNASGLVIGTAPDMRQMADILDGLGEDIAGIYAHRAGQDAAHWLGLMSAETWFSAQEAVDAGLADGVLSADPPKNEAPKTFDLRAYGFRYADRDQAPSPVATALSIRSAQLRAAHNVRREVRSK